MKKNLGKVAILTGSTLLTLLIAEIAMRGLDVLPRPLDPLPVPSYRLSANPVIAYEFRPGYKPSDAPFDYSHYGYSINSAGFRDQEHQKAKPDGTYRIVVLGDSTTAGNGVPVFESLYTERLEKLLNQNDSPGSRYEVLNMGVGGYHTMQEIETLKAKGLQYDPDMVLVTFCYNDLDLHTDGDVYYKLRELNGVAVPNRHASLYDHLLRRSRLAFIVHHRLNSSKSEYNQWYTQTILQGRSPIEAGFALLSDLQRQHGFTAIVVILPYFRYPFDQYKYHDTHAHVFAAAEDQTGIAVIDLLPRFAELDNDAQTFAFDGLHLNEHGHMVMAEILLPIIKEAIEHKGIRPNQR